MKRLVILVLLLILSATSFAARDLPIFHEWLPDSIVTRGKIHHWVLPNGLNVAFWENHTAPVVSCKIMIKTGSAHEGEYLGAGISHYLEHVVSGGTTSKRTENEYKELTQKYALSINAYTSRDVTVYYGQGSSKNFVPLLSMLSEFVRYCAFDSFEVAREKNVILQEIRKGREESERILWELFNETFYMLSPYRHPIIGYEEQFLKLRRSDLINYYNSKYAPNNAILAIAGDLTPNEVISIAESLFGDWERRTIKSECIPTEPIPVAPRVAEKEAEVKVASFVMGFPTTWRGDFDNYALSFLAYILAGYPAARLNMKLINTENPLAHSISAYAPQGRINRGTFIIRCSFDYENRDTIIKVIWNEIERIKQYGVTREEVERSKEAFRKNLMRSIESPSSQASVLMYRILNDGTPFTDGFWYLPYRSVIPEDVKRVAEKYLLRNRMVLAILKPKGAATKLDSLLAKAQTAQKPNFTLRKLPNGIKLILGENNNIPTFDFAIYLLGGSIYEPKDKAGLAKFTALYLGEGTRKFPSFRALQQKIEDLQMGIEHDAGRHTIFIEGKFYKGDFDEAMEIVSQMLLYPKFPRASEEKLRENLLAEYNSLKGWWYSEARVIFDKKFFGDHPYARPVCGYPETIKKLTARDAKLYWSSVLDPSRMVIAISGPMPVDEMERKLARLFGKIHAPSAEQSIAMIAKVPNLAPHEKPIYEKIPTERGQATLIIGFDAPTSYDEKDKWALRAAAGLLSAGSLSGWLYDELRGKRNLVYIAWASLSSMKHGGTFTITTQCAPEEFDTVYTIINNLIERLRKGDFAEEELKRIENSLAEKHDMAFQTQADFVNTMALDELYGFGFNYYTKYGERIKSVSKEDVVNAAKKYLANSVILVLMPKEYEN